MDVGADRTPRYARPGAPRPAWRGAHGGRGTDPRFFVVTAGHIAIVRPAGVTEELVAALRPGQFTGEVTMLSGRRGFVRIRAGEPGAVIEVEREHVLALVQTDSELRGCLETKPL